LGDDLVYAVHFIQNLARLDLGDPILGISLAVTHTDFGGFPGNRLVRKNPDPDAAATLDMTRHGATCGLDLARRQTAATSGLKPIFTEAYLVAARRNAGIPALLLLAVFTPGWL